MLFESLHLSTTTCNLHFLQNLSSNVNPCHFWTLLQFTQITTTKSFFMYFLLLVFVLLILVLKLQIWILNKDSNRNASSFKWLWYRFSDVIIGYSIKLFTVNDNFVGVVEMRRITLITNFTKRVDSEKQLRMFLDYYTSIYVIHIPTDFISDQRVVPL